MKMLISNWIDIGEKNERLDNLHNLPSYNYELIFCGSQEGFSRTIFEKKCFNIEQTVVIMKLKETGELVGGYNPVCWNLKEKSPDEEYWIETDKSFIFKIDQNQINNSILSRVKKPKYAIYHPKQSIGKEQKRKIISGLKKESFRMDKSVYNIKFYEYVTKIYSWFYLL